MFSCGAYFRRTIRILFTDLPSIRISSTRARNSEPLTFLYPRYHSTLQAVRKGHHRKVLRNALGDEHNSGVGVVRRRRNGPLPSEVRDALARENNRKHLSITDPSISGSTQFQLQWLQDPLKLANAVMERLRLGADQQALELIRGSEKTVFVDGEKKGGQVDNVVSWNHVMDYYMHKGDIKESLKVYNEMKKRGHRPEAHTYTIMLSGFTKNIDKPDAVKNAVSVYNSIFAPNSTVKPNTIHTNAVINACARAGDMDSLWSIAGRLPERGEGAADNITYTSILNAIKADAEKRSHAFIEGSAMSDKIIDSAVQDGERLWVDVNKKVRAGEFPIDEALVCAMGRLLLFGRKVETWSNVFSLVESSMRVPTYENSKKGPQISSSNPQNHDGSPGIETSSSKFPEITNFEPIGKQRQGEYQGRGMRTIIYPLPSNNTLSMLMQAAILTRNLPAGKYYWDLLTSKDGTFRVQFDPENFAQYLRLLRVSRSSKLARDLLCQDFKEKQVVEFLRRGTFIIAMSTCLRDKTDPDVFQNATDIFEMMQRYLSRIDAKVMDMYLEIALVTTPGLGFKHGAFNPDPEENNAMRVLNRFEPFIPEIMDMTASKIREEQYEVLPTRRRKKLRDPRDTPDRVYQHKETLSSFLTSVIGAYDRMFSQRNLPEKTRKEYLMRKRKIALFVTKTTLSAEPKGQERLTVFSERESGVREFENQEKKLDERARGIPAPIRYHKRRMRTHEGSEAATSKLRNHERGNRDGYQKGWGGEFNDMAIRQGSNTGKDFVSLGTQA